MGPRTGRRGRRASRVTPRRCAAHTTARSPRSLSCSEDDTVGDLKKLVAAQTGTRPDKLRIQKWHTVYKVGEGGRGRGVAREVGVAGASVATPPSNPDATAPPSPSQDHITLADYEIHDGMGLELYYN